MARPRAGPRGDLRHPLHPRRPGGRGPLARRGPGRGRAPHVPSRAGRARGLPRPDLGGSADQRSPEQPRPVVRGPLPRVPRAHRGRTRRGPRPGQRPLRRHARHLAGLRRHPAHAAGPARARRAHLPALERRSPDQDGAGPGRADALVRRDRAVLRGRLRQARCADLRGGARPTRDARLGRPHGRRQRQRRRRRHAPRTPDADPPPHERARARTVRRHRPRAPG